MAHARDYAFVRSRRKNDNALLFVTCISFDLTNKRAAVVTKGCGDSVDFRIRRCIYTGGIALLDIGFSLVRN